MRPDRAAWESSSLVQPLEIRRLGVPTDALVLLPQRVRGHRLESWLPSTWCRAWKPLAPWGCGRHVSKIRPRLVEQ